MEKLVAIFLVLVLIGVYWFGVNAAAQYIFPTQTTDHDDRRSDYRKMVWTVHVAVIILVVLGVEWYNGRPPICFISYCGPN